MKILFFNSTLGIGNKTSFSRNRRIPLGIAILASLIKRDHSVKIVDAQIHRSRKKIFLEINKFDPDFLCLSLNHIVQYNDLWRSVLNHPAKIIVGGIISESFARQLMKIHNQIDYIILGEAEIAFKELGASGFTEIENKTNILYRDRGRIVISARSDDVIDLRELPLPSFELFETEKYRDFQLPSPNLPFEFSRGCPNQCFFCDTPYFYNGFRAKSPEQALGEIIYLKDQFAIRSLTFSDSNLLAMKEPLLALSLLLIKHKINITVFFMSSINMIDDYTTEELITIFKAGFRHILIGLETTHHKVLMDYKKTFNTQDIFKRNNKRLKTIGFFRQYTMIVGHPETTILRLNADYAFLLSLKPEHVTFAYLTPYYKLQIEDCERLDISKIDLSRWDTERQIVPLKYINSKQLSMHLLFIKIKLFIHILWWNITTKYFLKTICILYPEVYGFIMKNFLLLPIAKWRELKKISIASGGREVEPDFITEYLYRPISTFLVHRFIKKKIVKPFLVIILSLLLMPVVCFLLFKGFDKFAFVLYFFINFLDCVDGDIARHNGMVSKSGAVLDWIADRIIDSTIILCIGFINYQEDPISLTLACSIVVISQVIFVMHLLIGGGNKLEKNYFSDRWSFLILITKFGRGNVILFVALVSLIFSQQHMLRCLFYYSAIYLIVLSIMFFVQRRERNCSIFHDAF